MELADYRLESHSEVTLFYKDGRQKLVAKDSLSNYLLPQDIERIQHAFTMRQDYFNDLPKWVKVIGIGIVALGLGVGGTKAAPSIQRALHQVIPAIPAPEAPIMKLPPNVPATAPAAQTVPVENPVTTPATPMVQTQQTPVEAPAITNQPILHPKAAQDLPALGVPKLPLPVPVSDPDLQAILRLPAKLLGNLGLK